MTLEQTRQQWYNEEILRLTSLGNYQAFRRYLKWFKDNYVKSYEEVRMKAYMKAKMEQQLKKGKK